MTLAYNMQLLMERGCVVKIWAGRQNSVGAFGVIGEDSEVMGERPVRRFIYLVLFGCSFADSAFAADSHDLLQFTCRPEYDWFSVQSMNVEYGSFYQKGGGVLSTSPEDPAIETDAQSQGIYTVKSIREKPYICNLDQRVIEVSIVNYDAEEYTGGSFCPLYPSFDVQISVDGFPTYTFAALGRPRCYSQETHLVTIKDQMLSDCKLPEFLSGGKLECAPTLWPEQLKNRSHR